VCTFLTFCGARDTSYTARAALQPAGASRDAFRRERRVAETRTGDSWRTTRAELGTIRHGHFRSRDGEFTHTTELTTDQRDLHRALEIPEPPRFGRITPA